MAKNVLTLTLVALLFLTVSAHADPATMATPQAGAEFGTRVTVEGTAPCANLVGALKEFYACFFGSDIQRTLGAHLTLVGEPAQATKRVGGGFAFGLGGQHSFGERHHVSLSVTRSGGQVKYQWAF